MATSIAPTKEDLTGKPHGSDLIRNHGGTRYDVVAFVALLFYVHGKHLRSCRDGQLT